MKKLIIALLILSITMLTGCNTNSDSEKKRKNSDEKSIEIIRCFDEKDKEGLKCLFCDEVKRKYDLDEEIQAAFEFYEGKSESYDLNYGGTAGGWENGECIDEHITPKIEKLITSSGNTYRIPYHEYVVYKDNPDCVGITYIRIFNESIGEMVQIGEHVY